LTFEQIGAVVYANLPMWRRMIMMENATVPQTEFTVHSTIEQAAAVVGALMNPGWMPDAALLNRQPKDPADLIDEHLYHP
jgi:hypothetical protein